MELWGAILEPFSFLFGTKDPKRLQNRTEKPTLKTHEKKLTRVDASRDLSVSLSDCKDSIDRLTGRLSRH